METFSSLLAICAGNSPVSGDFPAQRPVARSFDVFFYLRLNKRLNKQSWVLWFETPSRPLWRHCNVSGLPYTKKHMLDPHPHYEKQTHPRLMRCHHLPLEKNGGHGQWSGEGCPCPHSQYTLISSKHLRVWHRRYVVNQTPASAAESSSDLRTYRRIPVEYSVILFIVHLDLPTHQVKTN